MSAARPCSPCRDKNIASIVRAICSAEGCGGGAPSSSPTAGENIIAAAAKSSSNSSAVFCLCIVVNAFSFFIRRQKFPLPFFFILRELLKKNAK